MNIALSAPENKKKRSRKIPDYLVYEEFNGRKYYRKGYRDVLNQTKTLEEIMGSSSLQGIIISLMLRSLYKNLDESKFEVITNEIGLHISKGDNLSADIIVYDADEAREYRIDDHYFNVSPKLVIEVDVKIHTENANMMEYVYEKTDTLFAFGVEKVIWIFSNEKKIFLAEPNQDWIIRDWSKDFEIMPNYAINLLKMIEDRGYKID
jgi:Uma2 family endonuclease